MAPESKQITKLNVTLGDLLNAVYEEVAALPIANQGKNALAMFIVGEMLSQSGHIITLKKTNVPIPRVDYCDMSGFKTAAQAR